MMKNVRHWVLIGPGHWGSALASILTEKGIHVDQLGEHSSEADWDRYLEAEPYVLIATPFKEISRILYRLQNFKISGIVNASKGIDRDSLKTFSIIAKKILKYPSATLSGPTFAHEVVAHKPTACVVAGKNTRFVSYVAETFSSGRIRCYTSSDPIGVEVCGALKNVLAIAAGVSDGLGLGANSRAALLTRGLSEMRAVVKMLGGKVDTVYGLAGLGDLVLTATGDSSRNRQFGLKLAQGLSADEILPSLQGPAEGLYTVEQVHRLAQKKGVDLPICEQVYKVIHKKTSAEAAITHLMTRKLRGE
jgi:glycerol-3-phosphate dehydrogenase (NAD(P)+)